ncbi:MAG: DUF4402 domain-containing protein [Longimicrobiales bacterium]|nr:DUF4402 domain-containing protein [Longimicrobiales bacterium]
MRSNRLTLALALVAIAAPGALAAQANANIQATANVLTPLTVTAGNPLAFGDVFPGVAKTIAPVDAGVGSFGIVGETGAEVTLNFGTLPTQLSSGANTLPISFPSGSAAHGDGAADVTFDPNSVETTNLIGTALSVFIGGTVTPAVAQPAGAYSGNITLTVAYTGN